MTAVVESIVQSSFPGTSEWQSVVLGDQKFTVKKDPSIPGLRIYNEILIESYDGILGGQGGNEAAGSRSVQPGVEWHPDR